jgi:2-polyprenyl-3-methyl-5-hydroxy-6-metoxy-1,4-benzoquinol methylase
VALDALNGGAGDRTFCEGTLPAFLASTRHRSAKIRLRRTGARSFGLRFRGRRCRPIEGLAGDGVVHVTPADHNMMSSAEAKAYWDQRHRTLDDLRSGGDATFDRTTNEIFYYWRMGLLLRGIGLSSSPTAPLRMLDAGCGKGWFARALVRCGHQVDAIDGSEEAISHCRALAGGPNFARSSLDTWRTPFLYDVVYAIDVMFHVLDDEEWRSAVRNLASLVRLTGRLVLSDWIDEERAYFGRHQAVRPPSTYREVLGSRFIHDDVLPYDFHGSRVGLLVFTRCS